MPILIPCKELQPGMVLFDAIRRGGRVLLASKKELTRIDIEALLKRFPDMLVRVQDPELESAAEFENDAKEREVADTVRERIAENITAVEERFTERTSLVNVDFAKIHATVIEIVEYLKSHPASAALLPAAVDRDSYLSQRAGNVFYLAMLLGVAVREYIFAERQRRMQAKDISRQTLEDLTPLGLGAMFMDVGLLPLQRLFKVPSQLTPEENQQLRAHPQTGADMLPDSFSAVARVMIKTHHENSDGSGYPATTPPQRLHIFARIARIADAFDAATSCDVFTQARSPARALWETTCGPYRRYYDPTLLEVLARLIQPFPIGAKLQLEDGRYAVVVKYNRRRPFFPHLIIAFDRENQRLPNNQLIGPLTLDSRPHLKLARWGNEDLSFLNTGGFGLPRPPRSFSFKTVFEALYP